MDDRTEQQILEKAQYVRDAVTVLAENGLHTRANRG